MVVYCVCHVSIEEESRAHRHGSYRILLRFGSSFFSPPRIERRFEKGILAGNKFTRYSQHVADIIWSQSKIVVVEGTFQCDRLSAAQFQRKRTLGLRRENSYGSHSLTHSLQTTSKDDNIDSSVCVDRRPRLEEFNGQLKSSRLRAIEEPSNKQ
jgi:hypothetical protein